MRAGFIAFLLGLTVLVGAVIAGVRRGVWPRSFEKSEGTEGSSKSHVDTPLTAVTSELSSDDDRPPPILSQEAPVDEGLTGALPGAVKGEAWIQ